MVKRVNGIGINDADYVIRPRSNGSSFMCPAYKAWANMLKRAYCGSYHDAQPTYVGVTVCDDWISFMKFRSWWLTNSVDGWQLDKDLISDSRVYSPDTCIYVPGWLNKFTIGGGVARGEWPTGVTLCKRDKVFLSRVNNPISGSCECLGSYSDPIVAHAKWKKRKLEIAKELKGNMDLIDDRIYPRVITLIHRLN